jgi:hypothetical protein
MILLNIRFRILQRFVLPCRSETLKSDVMQSVMDKKVKRGQPIGLVRNEEGWENVDSKAGIAIEQKE